MPYPLLETIHFPTDLKRLSPTQLPQLAEELRSFLIESVARTGGHFSSGLGAVELTIALHYLLNTPEDRLIWDVGHQSYPHKILTGRRTQMHTLRQRHGIAPFPNRTESVYDAFGVGHSSTSISAALGMALANHPSPRKVVAVIGDGALTAGQAFEALNHAGDQGANLLVILNDNQMSISPNVGALSNRIARTLSNPLLMEIRENSKKILAQMPPPMFDFARKAEEHLKGFWTPGTMFEEFGFHYFGPIDGHDLDALLPTIGNLLQQNGPILLHVMTCKGKGYKLAEAEPVHYHGVGGFNPQKGLTPEPPALTYTRVFSDWLCDMAQSLPTLVGITPAMKEGSGLVAFSQQFPQRFYDTAITEQHAVTLAAGLACEGMRPVVAIYSTFLQRAYDQLIHDVALQNLPVLFAVDRAGIVGPDGATHAGVFDMSFLRCIPNLTIMAPANEQECRQMLTTGIQMNSPVVVRYPRGSSGQFSEISRDFSTLPINKAQQLRTGKQLALLAFGSQVQTALQLGELLDASVVNMRFVKPLDTAMLLEIAQTHRYVAVLEENVVAGGAGSAILECYAASSLQPRIRLFGLPDQFIEHGDRKQLLAECGLSLETLQTQLRQWLQQE